MVLISMWIVPAGEAVSVLALPQRTSCKERASGPIDTSTSALGATSAAESTTARPAVASSREPWRR